MGHAGIGIGGADVAREPLPVAQGERREHRPVAVGGNGCRIATGQGVPPARGGQLHTGGPGEPGGQTVGHGGGQTLPTVPNEGGTDYSMAAQPGGIVEAGETVYVGRRYNLSTEAQCITGGKCR